MTISRPVTVTNCLQSITATCTKPHNLPLSKNSCNQVKFELTCTRDSSVFSMDTVVLSNHIMATVNQLVLTTGATDVVQLDFTSTLTKVGTIQKRGREKGERENKRQREKEREKEREREKTSTTCRSISGFALPSVIHNNQSLL